MIDDLLRRYEFRGMTRNQVIDVLSPPAEKPYDPKAPEENWDMCYYLGLERGFFGLDDEYLVFHFDSRGKVNDVRVVIAK